jgi:hypothetical protein
MIPLVGGLRVLLVPLEQIRTYPACGGLLLEVFVAVYVNRKSRRNKPRMMACPARRKIPAVDDRDFVLLRVRRVVRDSIDS